MTTPPKKPTVRRQVLLTTRVVIDVPEDWDEAMIQFWLSGSSMCLGQLILDAADEVRYDGDNCNACSLSTAKLVPVAEEVKRACLDAWKRHPQEDDR